MFDVGRTAACDVEPNLVEECRGVPPAQHDRDAAPIGRPAGRGCAATDQAWPFLYGPDSTASQVGPPPGAWSRP